MNAKELLKIKLETYKPLFEECCENCDFIVTHQASGNSYEHFVKLKILQCDIDNESVSPSSRCDNWKAKQ